MPADPPASFGSSAEADPRWQAAFGLEHDQGPRHDDRPCGENRQESWSLTGRSHCRRSRVRPFRAQHQVRYQPPTDQQDFVTGQQVAHILGVSRHGLEALFRIGVLHNAQTIDFAPWRIPRAELESPQVRHVVRVMKANRTLPKNWGCPSNQAELFSTISTVQE